MANRRITIELIRYPSETLATWIDAKRYCSLIHERQPRIRVNEQWYRVVSATLEGDENQGQVFVTLKARIAPIRCGVCGEALLKQDEKAYGKHDSIEGCSAAITRHTERVLIKGSKKARQHLRRAQAILDEILVDARKIEAILEETVVP